MNSLSRRAKTVLRTATTPIAVLVASALVYQASYAAFTGQTRNSGNEWSTGSVALTDDDEGVARFRVANMLPNDTQTRCIRVTADATVPSTVKGYAVNPVISNAGLEDHILVTIKDGNGGTFSDCTGFVAENTIVPGVPLSTIASMNTYDQGIGGWNVAAGTSVKTYQLTWTFDTTGLTQTQIDQLQGQRTGIDMQWEMQST